MSYPGSQYNLPWVAHSIAGAGSGIVTRLLTQPLDVIKIRKQIQELPYEFRHLYKYRGMYQSFSIILKEEGIPGLWKGHIPAQYLSISFGFFQFATFEITNRFLNKIFNTPNSILPLQHFICGSLAGISGSVISFPFDLIRTRLILQGHPKVLTSMTKACISIIEKETVFGLYKGLFPTLLQIIPMTGFQFSFYYLFNSLWVTLIVKKDLIKDLNQKHIPLNNIISVNKNNEYNQKTNINDNLKKTNKIEGNIEEKPKPDLMKNLFCGSTSGLFAKVLVYPLDFAKKRLQMEGFEWGKPIVGKTHRYRGLIHCLIQVVKTEGFKALYKGLVPSCFKALSTSALVFGTYEQFCYIIYLGYRKFQNL